MSRLSTLYCHLASTTVTDKAVELILKNLVASSIALENLKLYLGWTKITDVSLRKISEKLERLSGLELNLKKTLITDEGVIPLVRDVLPAKKNLKQLKLNITGTNVSEVIKNEVQEFLKKY